MALGLISGDKLMTNRDTVEVWSLRDGHRIGVIQSGLSQVVDMSVSSDGHRLALAGEDSAIVIVDLDTLAIVHRLAARGELWALALDAHGEHVATVAATGGRGVTVRNTSDGATLFQQRGLPGYLEKIQYAPGDQSIVAVSGDSVVQVLSPSDGTVLRSFEGQSVAFDAVGKVMVTTDAHGRNVAELTDVNSGKPISTMDGRAGFVTAAEPSPDGALVVSGTIEGVISVWDARTGTIVKVLQSESDSPATCTRFDPSGEIVLACTLDGAIRTWRLPHSTPTPEVVDAIVRCKVPLRLEGGRLVPAEADLAACARIPAGALATP
jgi:WD40 repeat protein